MTIRIPEALDARLGMYAKAHGTTKTQIIEEALTMHLDVNTGLYDFQEPAIQRLNQLQDLMTGLSISVVRMNESLQDVVDLLEMYSSGDNFLKGD